MKTVRQYVTGVSEQLQDQRHREQFTRWSPAVLVGYLNDALSAILNLRPETFSGRVDVPLVVGYIQTIPAGWNALIRVESNPDGSRVYPADTELMRVYEWSPDKRVVRYDVDGNVVYAVRSFSIDPKDPKTFYVSPPVPAGVVAKALVTMVGDPPKYSTSDFNAPVQVPAGMENLIQEFMLGQAFTVDAESPVARDRSAQHFSNFFRFFGVDYKQASKFRSGNYMGSTPAGNPASEGA